MTRKGECKIIENIKKYIRTKNYMDSSYTQTVFKISCRLGYMPSANVCLIGVSLSRLFLNGR